MKTQPELLCSHASRATGQPENWLETLVLYRMHGRVKSAERWLSAGRARYSQRITHAEGFRNSNRAAIRRAKLMISCKSHPAHGRWTKISSWRVTDGWGNPFLGTPNPLLLLTFGASGGGRP